MKKIYPLPKNLIIYQKSKGKIAEIDEISSVYEKVNGKNKIKE